MTPATTPLSIFAPAPAHWAWRAWLHALGVAGICLVFSLICFSPRLWVFLSPVPSSTYWDRGLQFVAQVDQPLGSPTEPALVWRLAPVLAAKALGLHGFAAFALPWFGLLALLSAVARFAKIRFGDGRTALAFTALVASTHAALTVTGWLGVNDAWYALALLVVAFARSVPALAIAVAVGPWIDERFVLALPLAIWLRRATIPEPLRRALPWAIASVAFYIGIRLFNPLDVSQRGLRDFLDASAHLAARAWLPWVSLGWFMSLRGAWVLVAFAVLAPAQLGRNRLDWPTLALSSAPLVAITLLASDTTRAPTLLLPLLFVGAQRIADTFGAAALQRWLAALVVLNALLPAMHVTAKRTDVINALPVELARLFAHL